MNQDSISAPEPTARVKVRRRRAAGALLAFAAIGVTGLITQFNTATKNINNDLERQVNDIVASAPAHPIPQITGFTPELRQGSAWFTSGGLVVQENLAHAYANMTTYQSQRNWTGIVVECARLADADTKARAFRPMPDPAHQVEWHTALVSFHKAAAGCGPAARAKSGPLLGRVVEDLTDGVQHMQNADRP